MHNFYLNLSETVTFQIQNTIEKLFKVFAQTDQLHESTN